VIVVSWAVVAGLYAAFQVVTTGNVALNFILFGPVSLLGLGTVVPLVYVTRVRGQSLEGLGVTRRGWLPSVLIGLALGGYTYLNTLAEIRVPEPPHLVPLVAMSLTVGLFEAFFFRGWVQLGLERAFGAIPAVFLGGSTPCTTWGTG